MNGALNDAICCDEEEQQKLKWQENGDDEVSQMKVSKLTKKDKDDLLILRISTELKWKIELYCQTHEQNMSQFVRQSIRDRLELVGKPKASPKKIVNPEPIKDSKIEPRIYGDERTLHILAKNKAPHETLQEQWKREAEEDRLRQIGSRER